LKKIEVGDSERWKNSSFVVKLRFDMTFTIDEDRTVTFIQHAYGEH